MTGGGIRCEEKEKGCCEEVRIEKGKKQRRGVKMKGRNTPQKSMKKKSAGDEECKDIRKETMKERQERETKKQQGSTSGESNGVKVGRLSQNEEKKS